MGVTPTHARRELGKELQRLREAAKLTQPKVADACTWSRAKVARIEGGQVTLTPHDLDLLARLYQATDAERENLIVLLERTDEGQWWHKYGALVSSVLDELLSLEAQATTVHAASTSAFPGLLQSPDYARAVFARAAKVPDPDDVEALVELRIKRQRILNEGTELRALLGEELLLRRTGGPRVLRQQLEHVVTLSEHPHVTVQVLPLTAEAAVLVGNLLVFDFGADATSVAYSEHAGGMNPYHSPHDVRRLKRDFEYLRSQALSPEDTRSLMQVRLEEL